MLKGRLIHPEILGVLAGAGHGAQVLIADSNYPFSTGRPHSAEVVYLNLSPGAVDALSILRAVASAIPIESARVMVPDSGEDQPIFADFRACLDVNLQRSTRLEFYEAAKSTDTCLVIASGEQRIYANILLTIGVVPPPPG